MNLNKLNKNGYTTIKVKKEIINELKKDILNILYKKISPIRNFSNEVVMFDYNTALRTNETI